MSLTQMLLKEMEKEAQTTRKMLERVPTDKFDWKPHQKSMSVRSLSTHLAELPTWVSIALTTSELDFASSPYQPEKIDSKEELMAYFEKSLEDGKSHLSKAVDKDLEPNWTLRNGEDIYNVSTKAEVIRMTYCQIVHHRAQLGVFLRRLMCRFLAVTAQAQMRQDFKVQS